MNLGNQQVELTCPGCKRKFKQELARLQKNPTINCPGCHQPIKIDASNFNAGMKKIDQKLAELGKALGRIGKH